MAVLRAFRRSNILENNLVQTAASAGESLAAGVIFTIPALVLIGHWTQFDYWQVTAIALVGGIGAAILGVVPFVGGFLAAFVQSYAFLSFGCLLGFAVFKRAKELGVD